MASFQSFWSLWLYFGTCGVAFLLIVCVFCIYKNIRTLTSTKRKENDEEFRLPAVPEADLYLTDLIRLVYTHSDRSLRQCILTEGWFYLHFHRQLLSSVLLMTLLSLCTLLPTYLFSHSWTDINSYSLLSIQAQEKLLWIPLVVLYVFTAILVRFLYRFREKIQEEMRKSEAGIAAKTLEISNFPVQSDLEEFKKEVEIVIQRQLPANLTLSAAVEAIEIVPDLNSALKVLQKLKKALKIRKYYLENEEISGEIQHFRRHFCQKIPAVPYFSSKIQNLQSEYKSAIAKKSQSLGFLYITFRSRAIFVQFFNNFNRNFIPEKLNPAKWRLKTAPNAKEIIWENLTKSHKKRYLFLTNALFLSLFFVILTPFAFQEYITEVLNWLDLTSVLQNYLTPVLIYAYQTLILKRVVLFLVRLEGHQRASTSAISVFYKYYLYSLIYGFILPMLGMQTLHILYQYLVSEDNQHWQSVIFAGINSTGFVFTQVVINHCFVTNGMDLLQHSKYIKAAFRAAVVKLPEDKVRAFEAEEFPFGSSYAETTGVFTIVAAYSVAYPLILPFGLLYFVLRLSIQKYNILCFYVVTYDAYGRIAKHVMTTVALSIFLMQVGTLGVVVLNESELFYVVCIGFALIAGVQFVMTLMIFGVKGRKYRVLDETEVISTEDTGSRYLHPCIRPSSSLY